jgi:hypothetical protein
MPNHHARKDVKAGLLERTRGRYRNGPDADLFLDRASRATLAGLKKIREIEVLEVGTDGYRSINISG